MKYNKIFNISFIVLLAIAGLILFIAILPDGSSNNIQPTKPQSNIPTGQIILESYGYDVRLFEDDCDISETCARVIMISTSETVPEVATQVGSGFGALYRTWSNKNYYIVALVTEENRCIFGIDGDIVNLYMDGYLSDLELFLSIDSLCNDN